jgi:hypothetical protein
MRHQDYLYLNTLPSDVLRLKRSIVFQITSHLGAAVSGESATRVSGETSKDSLR